MTWEIHQQLLLAVLAIGLVFGAVAQKTRFCTLGAVSDWINMGDTGRMRSWVFAMALALLAVIAMEATGMATLGADTFPPYRTAQFAWLRYLVGGFLFGVGMTIASGCGNRTLVRIGGGNVKSIVVLLSAALSAYALMWTPLFERAFLPWIQATTIDLSKHGMTTQELGSVLAGMVGVEASRAFNLIVGAAIATGMLAFVFASRDFRESFDNILGGAVVGLCVAAGWFVTAGPLGRAWKDYAEMATDLPSRVHSQSLTFVAPLGDAVRFLSEPTNFSLINFGLVALAGVIFGAFIYSVSTRSFRYERFFTFRDFANHAFGGVLMGTGGVLGMGCTIGQGVTGISTLAVGSFLTFFAIVIGAALTMRYQYRRMLQEA